MIISNTPNAKTIILNGQEIYSPPIAYGKDHNTVLYEYMDIEIRVKSIQNEFDKLFGFIDDDKKEEAEQLLDSLENQLGATEPEIVRAQTLINFM